MNLAKEYIREASNKKNNYGNKKQKLNFIIKPTETKHRIQSKGDYVIALTKEKIEELKIKNMAVIEVISELKKGKKSDKSNIKDIRIHCSIIEDSNIDTNVDIKHTEGKDIELVPILVDQNIRNSLGVSEFRDKVKSELDLGSIHSINIYPLKIALFDKIKNRLSYIFGRRYLILRVQKSDVNDLEKQICRIDDEAIEILGTHSGSKVVVESTIKIKEHYFNKYNYYKAKRGILPWILEKIYYYKLNKNKDNNKYIFVNKSIKTYTLHDSIIARRKEAYKKQDLNEGMNVRFPDPDQLLNVEPDIHPIYMDKHDREQLGVSSLDVVKVKRSLSDLFFKEMRDFGVLFSITFLTTVLTLFQVFPGMSSLIIIAPIVSIVFSVLMIMLNIRARIK
ncbi:MULTISPECIES: hypothetical protein [Bacillaceae]|uniref:Uncharacterized protein n=1 Tax=Evansella alkalicola TaxID=745819 RepID=A0ABS6JYV6_9BACI|nr:MULTISPECIES: hypothetical protein [Bacillaceae]MBU9723271.1 hypothetical protein [Bacillus alkalicola]